MEAVTMAKAINLSLRDALTHDENVLIFGEDVGALGGVFRITDGLQKEFGEERVFDAPIAERARGYGFPGIRIDGNDVLGVYAAVRAAADRARQGEGPYLIEAVTYRMGAHTSSDDPTRYRTESELEAWNAKDPIARYRAWLEQQGIIDEGTVAAIADAAESAAQAMRARLTAMPTPPPGEAIFGRVYSNPPESFLREREEFESSLEGS